MSPEEIRFVRHSDPKEMVNLFFAPMMSEFGPVDLDEVGIQDETGNDFDGNEMLAGISEQGQWAFSDTKTNTVHWWAKDGTAKEMIVHMLAHEIAHIADPRKEVEECEMNAEKFGCVAELAFKVAMQ